MPIRRTARPVYERTQSAAAEPSNVESGGENAFSARTVALACITTVALATVAATAVSALVIERGEQGPKGPAGSRGLRGPTGPAGQPDTEAVMKAIEEDPRRAADAIQKEIDVTALEDDLDPRPSEIKSDVDKVERDLEDLCSRLRSVESLSDESFLC